MEKQTKEEHFSFLRNVRDFCNQFRKKLVRFLKELRRLDVACMLLAGAIHHTAGFTWGYNATIYFDQHLGSEQSGSTRTYLMIIVAVCGVAGATIGGTLTDYLGNRKDLSGIRAALVILVLSAVFAAPFFAMSLYFTAPYCFIFLAIAYCSSGRSQKLLYFEYLLKILNIRFR